MSQENKDKQAVKTAKIAKAMQPLFEMIRQDIENEIKKQQAVAELQKNPASFEKLKKK